MNNVGSIIFFLVGIAYYVFFAYYLQALAKKLGMENSWFAWVPILQYWLIAQMAGRDVLWFILLLIPCVSFIALIILFMDIAEKCGKERSFGILIIIPFVQIYILYAMASD